MVFQVSPVSLSFRADFRQYSMDGLSSAASAISVASLAIQLASSVKELYEFWGTVKEAPEEVRTITTDLKLLSSVLEEIALESLHEGYDVTMAAILTNCTVNVRTLLTILDAIEPGLASRSSRIRTWTAFKAALKFGKVKKFQETLEKLKGTLLLAQQTQQR